MPDGRLRTTPQRQAYPIYIQSTTVANSDTSSRAFTLPAAPRDGSVLALWSVSEGGSQMSSVSHTGVRWSGVGASASSPSIAIWMGVVTGGTSAGGTAWWSGSDYGTIVVAEFTNLRGVATDTVVTNSGTNSLPDFTNISPAGLILGVVGTSSFGVYYDDLNSTTMAQVPVVRDTTDRLAAAFGIPRKIITAGGDFISNVGQTPSGSRRGLMCEVV